PALIRKFHEAKMTAKPEIVIWGTGTPKREFLYVDDLAEACLFLMHTYEEASFVNIGVGKDISIADLAKLVQQIIGFQGSIIFDPSKPDGTPRKWMDVSKLDHLGWKASTSLQEGIEKAYEDFLKLAQ